MTRPVPRSRSSWLMNQPYLLLCLTSLFWAGNIVIGRFAAGQIPPMALSFIRWAGAFLIVLPFAWAQLARDWPVWGPDRWTGRRSWRGQFTPTCRSSEDGPPPWQHSTAQA